MGETNQIYRILFNLNIKIITTIMGKKNLGTSKTTA